MFKISPDFFLLANRRLCQDSSRVTEKGIGGQQQEAEEDWDPGAHANAPAEICINEESEVSADIY